MKINLKLAGAAALVAGGIGFGTAALAAPSGPATAASLADRGLIEHVAQGCGPGFFRGPRGFCRPMGGGYGRTFYGPRRCFIRPTPFGPRRVCR